MRFAAIADIHGNSAALTAVLADIQRQGIDDIVNLGDSLSGPMDPRGTADILMARDFPTVAGNHDTWLIDRPPEEMGLWEVWTYPELTESQLDWVRTTPLTLDWNGVFLCHATPENNAENWLDRRGPSHRIEMSGRDRVRARLGPVPNELILCGHTHTPRVVRHGSQIIANPGAVGCPAYLDDRNAEPFIHETGAPDARYGIFERTEVGWHTSLRTVPYDPSDMIARALDKGADSWASALRTGWFTDPV